MYHEAIVFLKLKNSNLVVYGAVFIKRELCFGLTQQPSLPPLTNIVGLITSPVSLLDREHFKLLDSVGLNLSQ